MIELLAQQQPDAGLGGILTNPIVMFVGIAVIWWFLVLAPQRKQEKARKAKLSAIKKGDKVLTRAGMYGVVSRVKEDVVIVRIDVDGKVLVPFQKTAIEDVLTPDADVEGK